MLDGQENVGRFRTSSGQGVPVWANLSIRIEHRAENPLPDANAPLPVRLPFLSLKLPLSQNQHAVGQIEGLPYLVSDEHDGGPCLANLP